MTARRPCCLFLGRRRERGFVLGLEAMTMMTMMPGGRRRLLFRAEIGLFVQMGSNGALRLVDEVVVEIPWAWPARPAPAMKTAPAIKTAPAMKTAPLPLPLPLLYYRP
jgi:hypothetical protein